MPGIAVMQPYLFPYLGYYQLAFHADEFVFLDDVNFIRQGHIHRNQIDLRGSAHRFTLPVREASQNRHIRDHVFADDSDAVLALIRQAYRKHPQFASAFPVVEKVLSQRDRNVAHVTALSIRAVFEYLGLARRFLSSGELPNAPALSGQDRIIDICLARGAVQYTNAIGGKALYSRADFAGRGLELRFLVPGDVVYRQPHAHFVASLSMIDVMMCCSPAEIVSFLARYTLD